MLGKFFIIFIPNRLKLLLLLTVLIDLLFKLVLQLHDRGLDRFYLRLLEVEHLKLVLLRLILGDLLRAHAIDSLVQCLELRLLERDLLAAVSLLFRELDSVFLRHGSLCTMICHLADATERALLHQ